MNIHYIYVVITDTYYSTYRKDNKIHRKYCTDYLKFIEGSVDKVHESIDSYLNNLKRVPRHTYSYIWSYCPIKIVK